MQEIVQNAYEYAAQWRGQGELADYIPSLADADPGKMAVVVTNLQGEQFTAGDSRQRFTMQSITKVILLAKALQDVGFQRVFQHVGMEPTGDPFNSIVRLEKPGTNKPLNPMINAGAIAVTSCIPGDCAERRFAGILAYARELLGNPALTWDNKTFQSEINSGDRNRALAYMMRSMGVIEGDIEQHIRVYFGACSLWVNCEEISYLGAVLANGGRAPRNGKQLIEPFFVKSICSLMTTCGLYDASGEFALRVGVPSKSGVGGGILGAVPDRMGIGCFSPALDQKGNSVCGVKAMEYLSDHLNLSIFASGKNS